MPGYPAWDDCPYGNDHASGDCPRCAGHAARYAQLCAMTVPADRNIPLTDSPGRTHS
jgi:hypothetical protein